MTTERFIRLHITASSRIEFPLKELFDGAENATDDEIDEFIDENAWEILADDDWLSLDADVRIVEREVAQ